MRKAPGGNKGKRGPGRGAAAFSLFKGGQGSSKQAATDLGGTLLAGHHAGEAVTFRTLLDKKWFGVWVGSLLAVLLGLVFLVYSRGKSLTQLSYDLPFQLRAALTESIAPDRVVIVYMEEQFQRRLPLTNFVERAHFTELLQHLRLGGAQMVVFDALLNDEDPFEDERLANEIAAQTNVVLASHAVIDRLQFQPPIHTATDRLLSRAATNGLMQVKADGDNTVRELRPIHFRLIPRPTFSPQELTNLSALAAGLQQRSNAVSEYVLSRFTERTRRELTDHQAARLDADRLRIALVQELNTLLEDRALYEPRRFSGVALSTNTQAMLQRRRLSETDLPRLNRLLIEDTYPQALAKRRWGREDLATLAWAAATRLKPGLTNRVVSRLPRLPHWWVNYYGPAGTIRHTSNLDVAAAARSGFFRDRIVLVGMRHTIEYAAALPTGHDTFKSPYGSDALHLDGVEIHATVLLNLLTDSWLEELSPWLQILLIVSVGGLLGYALPKLRPLAATGVALLAALLTVGLALGLTFGLRYWFPWLVIVAVQIPIALGWAVVYAATKAYIENQLLVRSLSLYLSPKQVQNLQRRPELLQRGGRQQTVSILFSDIASFAKIAERMDAEDLVRLLNQYYENAIACIHQTDGTVMKLIGDAIFAIWNAPEEQPDHRARAGRAALRLNEQVAAFNAQQGRLPLKTRVGLHTGTACVGNIGSSDHFDYTAIGEAVNLANRLESLNKQLETNVLATRDFLKGLEDQFVSRMVGYFRLKGFDHVVEVHEVLAFTAEAEASAVWRRSFGMGLHHFVRRDFEAAERAFRDTLAARPGDGPTWYYLHTLSTLRTVVLPRDWAGEIDLKEK